MLIREMRCFEWKKEKKHHAPASLMTKAKDVFVSKSNSQGSAQKVSNSRREEIVLPSLPEGTRQNIRAASR